MNSSLLQVLGRDGSGPFQVMYPYSFLSSRDRLSKGLENFVVEHKIPNVRHFRHFHRCLNERLQGGWGGVIN